MSIKSVSKSKVPSTSQVPVVHPVPYNNASKTYPELPEVYVLLTNCPLFFKGKSPFDNTTTIKVSTTSNPVVLFHALTNFLESNFCLSYAITFIYSSPLSLIISSKLPSKFVENIISFTIYKFSGFLICSHLGLFMAMENVKVVSEFCVLFILGLIIVFLSSFLNIAKSVSFLSKT